MRRRLRNIPGIFFYFLLQVINGKFQLCVLPLKCFIWKVVNFYIGIYSVAFNEPFAFRNINAIFCRAGNSIIDQKIIKTQPYLASPCSHTNYLTHSQSPKSLRMASPSEPENWSHRITICPLKAKGIFQYGPPLRPCQYIQAFT